MTLRKHSPFSNKSTHPHVSHLGGGLELVDELVLPKPAALALELVVHEAPPNLLGETRWRTHAHVR